jgi:tRNA nucleotidyltransferase/poly(A) polymerase
MLSSLTIFEFHAFYLVLDRFSCYNGFMKMPLPHQVVEIHAAFKAAGEPLFVVGGAVRDFASNHTPKDYDLATSAHPDRVEGIVSRLGAVKAVGKSFGVILVSMDGEDFEIATFRKDSKSGDGRRPESVTFSTIEEDAARRDLTINALYYDLDTEKVIDFHGGLQDLLDKNVRFVGDASERLEEDRLRALRFVRFFCRINPGFVENAAVSVCALRPAISDERIRDEFLKGLKSAIDRKAFVENLNRLNLLRQIFPHLTICANVLSGIFGQAEIIAQILWENSSKVVLEKLLELKYSVQEAQDVVFLLKLNSYSTADDIVTFVRDRRKCSLSDEAILNFAQCFYTHRSLLEAMMKFPYPTVRGEELMDRFQGKELGAELVKREIANFKKTFETEIEILLRTLYELTDVFDRREAAEKVYEFINGDTGEEHLAKIDAFLLEVDVKKLPVTVLMSIAKSTYPYRLQLFFRERFVKRAKEAIGDLIE